MKREGVTLVISLYFRKEADLRCRMIHMVHTQSVSTMIWQKSICYRQTSKIFGIWRKARFQTRVGGRRDLSSYLESGGLIHSGAKRKRIYDRSIKSVSFDVQSNSRLAVVFKLS